MTEALDDIKQSTNQTAKELNSTINEAVQAARVPEAEHVKISTTLTPSQSTTKEPVKKVPAKPVEPPTPDALAPSDQEAPESQMENKPVGSDLPGDQDDKSTPEIQVDVALPDVKMVENKNGKSSDEVVENHEIEIAQISDVSIEKKKSSRRTKASESNSEKPRVRRKKEDNETSNLPVEPSVAATEGAISVNAVVSTEPLETPKPRRTRVKEAEKTVLGEVAVENEAFSQMIVIESEAHVEELPKPRTRKKKVEASVPINDVESVTLNSPKEVSEIASDEKFSDSPAKISRKPRRARAVEKENTTSVVEE